MDEKFMAMVDRALDIVRRHDLAELGRCELTRLHVVQKRLHGHQGKPADVYVGQMVREVVREVVEERLKPSTEEDYNRLPWRCYLFLSEYILRGEPYSFVAERMGLEKSAFYDLKKYAVQILALELWNLEEETLRTPPTILHNLQRQYAPFATFVRRLDDADVDYVDRVISVLTLERFWIVAISGHAGIGKSSLAWQIANVAKEKELFSAIVWVSARSQDVRAPEVIVPEGAKTAQYPMSLATVLDTIGDTLGSRKVLSAITVEEKLDMVFQLLQTTSTLIVVDNLETVTDDARRDIISFLSRLPQPAKAITTHREKYDLGGVTIDVVGMREAEATKFMQQEAEARGHQPLSEQDMIYIYKASAGIPLVMKTAIGSMSHFGMRAKDAISLGIEQEHLLPFMYAGSYSKLPDNARKILHVMPIFAQPARREAIAAAAACLDIQAVEGLSTLYSLYLVDKPTEDRYDILPSLRAFLQADDFKGTVFADGPRLFDFLVDAHRRLARYYADALKTLQRTDPKLQFLRDDKVDEKPNVLALLDWCYQQKEWQLVVDLVDQMSDPWRLLRRVPERLTWGARAVEACEQLKAAEQAAWFQVWDVEWALLHKSDNEEAKTAVRSVIMESLRQGQENGWKRVEAVALGHLGQLARISQDYPEAERYFALAVAAWRDVDQKDRWMINYSLSNLGLAEYRMGKLDEARAHLEEALRIQDKTATMGEIAHTKSRLALVQYDRGEHEQALRLADEAMALAKTIQKPAPAYGYACLCKAELMEKKGNLHEAVRLLQDSLSTYSQLGAMNEADQAKQRLSRLQPKG